MNEIFKSIKRTPYQSLANFSVLFFTLFLSILVIFFLTFLYGLLGYVETRPQVTIYFRNQTSEADIVKMKDELINTNKVLSIKYISKNDAFKIYKDLNKDNPLLLEMVSADILPASLEIYAKKPSYLPEIANMLKNKPGVDEVDFQKIIIERLITLTNTIKISTLIFFTFMIFTTMITLIALGHFKIALKKEEIELPKLLGATNYYVQKPFLNEGLVFGLMSAVAAFLIFLGGLFYFQPFLSSYMKGINNLVVDLQFFKLIVWPINVTLLASILLITVLFSIIISIISTLLATRKYLNI